MKIVTCASYYGTGSSAVTDLIGEYEGVKSLGDYEFAFAHELDGISDLEFHLVNCPDRHKSGHALKRFERISHFNAGRWFNKRYEPYFNGQYWRLTEEYINSILEFKYKGYSFRELYEHGLVFYYAQSFLKQALKKVGIRLNVLPKSYLYYAQPSEQEFLEKTKCYTSQLLAAANPEHAPFLMVDQLLPSSNINRCLRYFESNVQVLVVDRDPRDVYLANKFVWHVSQVPIDVKAFCQWFEYTHRAGRHEQWDKTKVLKINFEDIIYRYPDTKARLEQFLGLVPDVHIQQFRRMNPKRSVVNTQLWKKYDDAENIRIIEKELKDYLFDYTTCENNEIMGIEPINNTVF